MLKALTGIAVMGQYRADMEDGMFETEIQNQMENSWFVVHNVPDETCFEEDMLFQNPVPGILMMETLRISDEKLHRYNINGCSSLRESLCGRKLSGEEFRMLMSGIFTGIREGREYLLQEDSFLLNPDTIFVRNDTGEPMLVYCPEAENNLNEQIRILSDWILEFLDVTDAQAIYGGYAFHVMSHEGGSSMQKLLGTLAEEPGEASCFPVRELPPTGDCTEPVTSDEYEVYDRRKAGNGNRSPYREKDASCQGEKQLRIPASVWLASAVILCLVIAVFRAMG